MTSHPNRDKALGLLRLAGVISRPVDVNKIAKLLGFDILPYPFPNKRRGMVFIEGKTKVIGVNSTHPITMQRYTIAHELGHFVNGHAHVENDIIEDDTKYYNHHFQQEREADAFATELLTPKHLLEQDLATFGLDIPRLVVNFQVSEQSIIIRLKSLRLFEKYSFFHSK